MHLNWQSSFWRNQSFLSFWFHLSCITAAYQGIFFHRKLLSSGLKDYTVFIIFTAPSCPRVTCGHTFPFLMFLKECNFKDLLETVLQLAVTPVLNICDTVHSLNYLSDRLYKLNNWYLLLIFILTVLSPALWQHSAVCRQSRVYSWSSVNWVIKLVCVSQFKSIHSLKPAALSLRVSPYVQ